jgi:hypothetical protein
MRNSNQKDKFLVILTHKIALIEVISHDCHKFSDVILATRAWNIRGFFTQADKQPRSQALPSCLRKEPGWGWSRVTRISRGKLKLSLG